jgi:hypothetical protein
MRRDKVDKQAHLLLDELEKFVALADSLERVRTAHDIANRASLLENYAVYEARAHGVSWAAIGEVYGYTRQGAQKRFGGA